MPTPRVTLPAMIRGFGLMVGTPFVARRLPLRTSGAKRKRMSLIFFMTRAWQRFTGREKLPSSYLPMESFVSYVSRIDALLDKLNRAPASQLQFQSKKDSIARQHISDFVKGTRTLILSPEKKRELYRLVIAFRKEAWHTVISFEENHPTLEQVLKMKEKTTGGLGRVIAAMLNVSQEMHPTERKRVEDAFADVFMAIQIPDDIFDIAEDRAANVANLAVTILEKYPSEKAKTLHRERFSIPWMQKNCPRTYHELHSLFEGYMQKVPGGARGEQTVRSLPVLFWKIARLTKR